MKSATLNRRTLALSVAMVVGGPAVAQDGSAIGPRPSVFRHTKPGLRYRAVHVEGATEACVVLAIGVGSRHDPDGQSGRAAVIGRLIARLDAELPERDRRQFGVYGRCTVVSGRARSPGQLDTLLDAMGSLIDGSLAKSLDDDAIELAIGDALLVADDGAKLSKRDDALTILRAPDEAAQEVLNAGMARRDAYDFAGAIAEYDRLIKYCPDYAEGFNQRAYIHFLRGDHERALIDLDVALRLQPYHVAAQSGRALTLMNLGQLKEARAQLLIAVENNPWLSEAALLADGAPLGVKGKDI